MPGAFVAGAFVMPPFTSDGDVVGDVFTLPPLPGCHHCPVVFQFFPHDRASVSLLPAESVRLWSKGNFKAINIFLMTMDWDCKFEGKSAQDCYIVFLHLIVELIDQFVPCKVYNRNDGFVNLFLDGQVDGYSS